MINHRSVLVILLACSAFAASTGISTAAANDKALNPVRQALPGDLEGKVTQVIDSAGYTYAEVDTGKGKVWAAGPVTPLKVGDKIMISTRMPMHNFHSQSMGRDFSVIYFVDNFVSGGATPEAKKQTAKKPSATPVEGIRKAEGGRTIAEIYSGKNDLNGKTVRVRGKVTRLTTGVLDKNWLHIMDSSSPEDLTVTTTDKADIGDVVLVEGKIGLDRDYGYGYVYPVIMEDAKIRKK